MLVIFSVIVQISPNNKKTVTSEPTDYYDGSISFSFCGEHGSDYGAEITGTQLPDYWKKGKPFTLQASYSIYVCNSPGPDERLTAILDGKGAITGGTFPSLHEYYCSWSHDFNGDGDLNDEGEYEDGFSDTIKKYETITPTTFEPIQIIGFGSGVFTEYEWYNNPYGEDYWSESFNLPLTIPEETHKIYIVPRFMSNSLNSMSYTQTLPFIPDPAPEMIMIKGCFIDLDCDYVWDEYQLKEIGDIILTESYKYSVYYDDSTGKYSCDFNSDETQDMVIDEESIEIDHEATITH